MGSNPTEAINIYFRLLKPLITQIIALTVRIVTFSARIKSTSIVERSPNPIDPLSNLLIFFLIISRIVYLVTIHFLNHFSTNKYGG